MNVNNENQEGTAKENVNSKKKSSNNSNSNYNKKSELNNHPTKTNFQIFMDELLDKLRNVNLNFS